MLSSRRFLFSCNKLLVCDYSSKAKLDSIIRVDHAGELGADRIYAGQMAVLGTTSKGPLIQHMWDQEKQHRAKFEDLIKQHRVRPTVMTPIWNVAGFVLGLLKQKTFFVFLFISFACRCWISFVG